MADDTTLVAVSGEPLDLATHLAAVDGPDRGAAASFLGVVRNHDPEASGPVVSLEYSAHPEAGRVLGEIVARVRAEFAEQGRDIAIAASHRVGHLEVGDVALVVAVASAHRAEAFDGCRAVVEAIKAEIPVWKKQVLADGSYTWVGSA